MTREQQVKIAENTYNNLSDEKIRQIAVIMEENKREDALPILLKELGIRQYEAYYIGKKLREEGMLRDKHKDKWSVAEIATIKSMVDAGHMLSEIAATLDRCYDSIRKKVIEIYGEVPIVEIEGEQWKLIGDTDYEISNCGRLRRKGCRRLTKGTLSREGYIQTTINGRLLRLHRLVAQAFIPNPENKDMVDHIDGNRTNNDVSNLRWVTSEENANNENRIQALKNAAELRRKNAKADNLLRGLLDLGFSKLELIKRIVEI